MMYGNVIGGEQSVKKVTLESNLVDRYKLLIVIRLVVVLYKTMRRGMMVSPNGGTATVKELFPTEELDW